MTTTISTQKEGYTRHGCKFSNLPRKDADDSKFIHLLAKHMNMQAEECAWLYLHGERIVYEKLLNGVAKLERILEEKKEEHIDVEVVSKKDEKANESGSGSGVILCVDRLREELSCAISVIRFCSLCLKSYNGNFLKFALFGRCIWKSDLNRVRHLVGTGVAQSAYSNGRSCTTNIVLWNTIRLLFPQ
ncbi:hypothetical protein Tco_0958578 [Tanacetum coccineum]